MYKQDFARSVLSTSNTIPRNRVVDIMWHGTVTKEEGSGTPSAAGPTVTAGTTSTAGRDACRSMAMLKSRRLRKAFGTLCRYGMPAGTEPQDLTATQWRYFLWVSKLCDATAEGQQALSNSVAMDIFHDSPTVGGMNFERFTNALCKIAELKYKCKRSDVVFPEVLQHMLNTSVITALGK